MQKCLAKTILLSQTSIFWLFFIQFQVVGSCTEHRWSCSNKHQFAIAQFSFLLWIVCRSCFEKFCRPMWWTQNFSLSHSPLPFFNNCGQTVKQDLILLDTIVVAPLAFNPISLLVLSTCSVQGEKETWERDGYCELADSVEKKGKLLKKPWRAFLKLSEKEVTQVGLGKKMMTGVMWCWDVLQLMGNGLIHLKHTTCWLVLTQSRSALDHWLCLPSPPTSHLTCHSSTTSVYRAR